MITSFKEARRLVKDDPVASDLHIIVYANLAELAAAMYIGADLNVPNIWFYLTIGVLLTRLKSGESSAPEVSQATPVQAPLLPRPSLL